MNNKYFSPKELIKKYRYDIIVIFTLVVVVWIAYIQRDKFDVFSDRLAFENFINDLGFWGPLAIVGSITLEVVVAPIPGYIPAITAGFVFGPILGSLYTFIGNVLGTAIVFFVARKYGKKLVLRFMKKERLEKYGHTISKHENWLLFFYFFPIIPIDVISAAFGLSKIHWKKFFIVSSLGFIVYSTISTNFGDYLSRLWF